MKALTAAFLLISNICFAQGNGPLIDGFTPRDCYIYTLELFTKNDTAFSKLSGSLLKPETKTIYVLKTKHVSDLPEAVNGYRVKCIDADSNKKMLYTEQTEHDAVILYLDRMHFYGQKHNMTILPVQMAKKRRKRIVGFENRGYKTFFNFQGDINKFRFDRTEYFDYTLSGRK